MASVDSAKIKGAIDFDGYWGPERFAKLVLAARREPETDKLQIGHISASGLKKLVQIAYYASQAPNEGRFPQLTIFVPARRVNLEMLVSLDNELTVQSLRRIGPTLPSPDYALIIRELHGSLRIAGIAVLRGPLTQFSFGDPTSRPRPQPTGLSIEISGPGELRAGEHLRHKLQSGSCHQEISFGFAKWFKEWYDDVAPRLFSGLRAWRSASRPGSLPPLAASLGYVWIDLLRRAAGLRHGGCFIILAEPSQPCIRDNFKTSECDLGMVLAQYLQAVEKAASNNHVDDQLEQVIAHLLLRENLLSTVVAICNLSATDGCLVFDRLLKLHSFGSMIEPSGYDDETARCFRGDSDQQLDQHEVRNFGARRLSALHLCAACPGALAFVISQDGDLRAFVHRKNGVRLYDNLALW
jgi:hypothetical protein